MNQNYDIIIIGCGLVGGSLALTLPDNLSIAVIDAESPMQKQPGYLALNIHSCSILKQFGVWDDIVAHHVSDTTTQPYGAVTSIKQMDVSELPNSTGQVILRAEDIGAPALGYVTSTIAIRETLLAHIQSKKNITLYCPEKAEDIQWPDEGMEKVTVTLANKIIDAKLVIMADGGRSPLRQQLGFTIDEKKSALLINHYIVISRVKTTKPHNNLAFERFTTQGPIALLPVNQDEYILVWTIHQDQLPDFLAQDEKTLINALAIAYDNSEIKNWHEIHEVDPNKKNIPARKHYPVSCSLVKNPIKTRLVLMGNAAHTVHPVGAQGFNLSLKDALSLSTLIQQAVENKQDIGSEQLLKNYLASRQEDTNFVLYFTQSLLSTFSHNSSILATIRRLGMAWMNQSSMMKQALLKQATGQTTNRPVRGSVTPLAAFGVKITTGAHKGTPPQTSEYRQVSSECPQTPEKHTTKNYDIIILGNRLIGSTLACALDPHYRIAIIDKASTPPPPKQDTHKSDAHQSNEYDLRINAYNRASQKLLESIGVWQDIPADRRFVFDKVFATSQNEFIRDDLKNNQKKCISFDSHDINESHIGHFIENDLVTYYLHQKIKTLPNVDFFDNTSVVDIQSDGDTSAGHIHIITDNNTIFSGKLLAACDGANSTARNLLNIDVSRHPYYQRCIVANIFFDGDLDKTAWQNFLKTGPLGLLPLRKGVCSLAWSCDNDTAQKLLALPDNAFIAELDKASLGRLGKITKISQRQSFPLVAQHAEHYTAPRTLLLGDAAHTIHPLGGLGANLGFQDVIAATELLNTELKKHPTRDIGRRYLLEKYEKMRRRHNALVMSSMTTFNALFHQEHPLLNPLGRLSLDLTQKITPIKNALFRQAMWMSEAKK